MYYLIQVDLWLAELEYDSINNIPSGCMVIVAIMTHSGYNQEDSIYLIKVQLTEVYFRQLFSYRKR